MFTPFPKIGRLSRNIVVTEKIDGTNASIEITTPTSLAVELADKIIATHPESGLVMLAGSRTRYITPQDDNFGFARWAQDHADALWTLGEGQHFGEWWGKGIQRGYGLSHKRFSLFNTNRWDDAAVRPTCCAVVPTLYIGPFRTEAVDATVEMLRQQGSLAAPGFMNPEGVIVFHTANSVLFKKTLEKDEQPKGREAC